jgi:hypothetical protein
MAVEPRREVPQDANRRLPQSKNEHDVKTTTKRRHSRRGTAYVLVLAISMLVAVIGMGGMLAARSQSKSAEAVDQAGEARMYALAATELARLYMDDKNWRSTRTSGTWATNQTIGSGTYSIDVVDTTDGNFANNDTDTVLLTATGVRGSARQKLAVTLKPNTTAYTCLNYAIAVNGSATITSTTVNGTTRPLGCNATVTAAGTVMIDVEAVTAATGAVYGTTPKTGILAMTVPDSSVFNFYTSNGTVISIDSIPAASGVHQIQKVVISPASNPYNAGATNTQGIYVIDCLNRTIQISKCRIVGTLCLLNVGANSSVSGSVSWVPVVSKYPCLLAQGNMALNMGSTALAENATDAVSYNPAGTPYPYPSGTTNATFTDVSYSSSIKGLVYVSGDVTTNSAFVFNNLVVGGNLTCTGGSLTPTYDGTYYSSPGPGFYPATMAVQSGTWKRPAS